MKCSHCGLVEAVTLISYKVDKGYIVETHCNKPVCMSCNIAVMNMARRGECHDVQQIPLEDADDQ